MRLAHRALRTGPNSAVGPLGLALPLAALALQLLPGDAVDPECECLNWRQVYKSGRVVCGEGAELWAGFQKLAQSPQDVLDLRESVRILPVCDDFYRRLDNNYCANLAHSQPGETQWFGGTWCYVSNDCQDLSGGRRLADTPVPWSDKLMGLLGKQLPKSGNASWKICTPSTKMVKQDTQLRDLPLEEVFAMIENFELDAGIAAKSSMMNSWQFWPAIEEFWEKGNFSSLPDVIQESMALPRPILVDTQAGGTGDLKIVYGKELHTLELRPSKCGPTRFCRKRQVHGEL